MSSQTENQGKQQYSQDISICKVRLSWANKVERFQVSFDGMWPQFTWKSETSIELETDRYFVLHGRKFLRNFHSNSN